MVLIGIEVADTTAGRGLTADVARAVRTVADAIERIVATSGEGPGRVARAASVTDGGLAVGGEPGGHPGDLVVG